MVYKHYTASRSLPPLDYYIPLPRANFGSGRTLSIYTSRLLYYILTLLLPSYWLEAIIQFPRFINNEQGGIWGRLTV